MEGARRGVDAVVTVYRWNKKRKIFKQFQDINSKLPRDIEHFTIDGEDYLAVGNHADQTGIQRQMPYLLCGVKSLTSVYKIILVAMQIVLLKS